MTGSRQPAPERPTAGTPYYKELPAFRPDADPDVMLDALSRDGFVFLRGVLTAGECAAARAAADRLEPGYWDFTGKVDHFKNVFNRDPFWLSFLDRPGVIDLADAALGDNSHVVGQTAWRCHPGFRGVGLHLDYLPAELPAEVLATGFRMPAFLCTAHFFLCDITPDLCPTHVVPGSHRAGRKPQLLDLHWNGRAPQPVLCAAGDVLLFRSDLWHSGSSNTTRDRTRYLLQVHYGRREMAAHFAPYLDWKFNPEVLAACSYRQRRLLGDHPQGAYD